MFSVLWPGGGAPKIDGQ